MSSTRRRMPAEATNKQLKELADRVAELNQINDGTHPELVEKLSQLREKGKEDAERVEINYEFERRRIEDEYAAKMAQNRMDMERKLKQNRENLLREIEDAERQIEHEFQYSEIGKVNNSVVETNKKTLRGRGGGVLVEPPTYFNATPKPATPNIAPSTNFLLSDAEIAADVRAISTAHSPQKARRLYDVSLTKQRLLYDGKTYKQGEEVHVENAEYGKFPARLDIITDVVITFKAMLPWDTRQIHASCADLVEGRVQVAKKRNN